MNKITIPLFVLIIFSLQIKAQVKTNFNNTERVNERGQFNKSYAVPIFEITPPDITTALQRDKTEDSFGSKVFYIAEPVATNINAVAQANWVSDGKYSFGKFTLHSKGAKTLSINFSNFILPKGTEMYIYNKDAEMITGVITEAENNEKKIWGSSIYKGDILNIEIKLPLAEKQNLNLWITNVAYGYKDIFISKVAGFGLAGLCHVNVLCPLGNNWVPERNSVAYIAQSNGAALCSGAMVMNTCATNIPYVLTADHCFQADGNVAGWRVHFQAWSATCTPSQNSDGILFNGSTLRANWGPSDFCLVELNQIPAVNSGIRYAGWSRQTNAATSGVGIHHPSGDVMKISSYTTPLVREDNPTRCGINPVGELQWVVQWNQGVTEGGSSGSPLFDQNHRIVGQLSGGPSDCSQLAKCRMDMYGRFDNSWTGGGTNTTRLSNWLDPSNSGAVTTNIANINTLQNSISRIPSTGLQGDNSFCTTSNNYTIQNLPANASVIWSTVPTWGYVTINSPNAQQTTLSIINSGTITLNATITNCEGSVTVSKQVIVGNAPPSISASVSGCNGSFQVWNLVNNNPTYGTNWNWTVDYLSPPSSQINIYTPNQPSTYASVTGGGTVKLHYTGLCGAGQTDGITIYNSGCYGSMVSVSPNPAKNSINVSIAAKTNDKTLFDPSATISSLRKVKSRGMTVMSLFNAGTNMLVKQWKQNETTNKNYNLNINGLRKGVYVLQVDRDNQTTVTKVIIE